MSEKPWDKDLSVVPNDRYRSTEGMTEKEIKKLSEKIEEAVNTLSLENYLDMPDFIIAEMLVFHLNTMIKAHNKNEEWKQWKK